MVEIGLFFIGLILSFIGSLPFGMINIAVIDITIRKGYKHALMFGAGAAFIEFWQALIATKFSFIFTKYPTITTGIEWVAIFIFFALGFYYLNHKPDSYQPSSRSGLDQNLFWKGVGVSALNVMAYPYWLFYSAWLASENWLQSGWIPAIVFSAGIMCGGMLLFTLYSCFGLWLVRKSNHFQKWSTRIFAGMMIALGIIQLIRVIRVIF